MSPSQDTLDEAKVEQEGRCWWWRGFFFPGRDDFAYMAYQTEFSRCAFLYELAARIKGQFEFGKDFSLLKDGQRNVLARRWPTPETVGSRIVAENGWMTREGWTAFQNQSYNLRLNDESLVKAFLGWIRRERHSKGIPNPRPNAGRANRTLRNGLSWRPVELMDIAKYVRPLNDSERSQVSKAKRFYEKESRRRITVDTIRPMPHRSSTIEGEESL
jgi:hypothetical protein